MKEPLKKQIANAKDAQVRALAEMENMRRREAENRKNWGNMAVADFLSGILPRLNELQTLQNQTDDENTQKVLENLLKGLEKAGLRPIKPQKDDKVDANKHEVLMAAEGKAGCVVMLLEPGWEINGTTLVAAKVSACPEN